MESVGWLNNNSDNRTLVCLAEELLDVSLDVTGEKHPAVALEWHPIRPDKELFKVPGHVVPADWAPDDELGVSHQGGWLVSWEWEVFSQERKQRMSVFPIHIHLFQELKLWLKAVSRTDIL